MRSPPHSTDSIASGSRAHCRIRCHARTPPRQECLTGSTAACPPSVMSHVTGVRGHPATRLASLAHHLRRGGRTMAADADVIRRMTNEVFLAGNLGALDELLADNLVDHDPPPGIPGTKDGWKQLAGMVVGAFSDRKMEFDDYDTTSDGCVVESWAM